MKTETITSWIDSKLATIGSDQFDSVKTCAHRLACVRKSLRGTGCTVANYGGGYGTAGTFGYRFELIGHRENITVWINSVSRGVVVIGIERRWVDINSTDAPF